MTEGLFERKINLMDERLSPRNAYEHFAQKENPRPAVTEGRSVIAQSGEEIISFVVEQMSGTIGA
ncbi:MAG: hypothetical protein Pg6C_17830 [Treponemataceae bacterium]|nr:MAG: hypothetical protein Pg6C_17830 [Treponemataceae bacterium]